MSCSRKTGDRTGTIKSGHCNRWDLSIKDSPIAPMPLGSSYGNNTWILSSVTVTNFLVENVPNSLTQPEGEPILKRKASLGFWFDSR
jgi:hypothetical protein